MASTQCDIFTKSASLICSKCESSASCSFDRLSRDLPTHKSFCNKFARFISANPRPADKLIESKEVKVSGTGPIKSDISGGMNIGLTHSNVSRLGLLLPVSPEAARYVWVTYHQTIYGNNVDENVDEFDTLSAGRIEITKEDSIIEFWFQEKVGGGTKSDFRTVSTLDEFNKRDRKTPILALRYRYNVGTSESFGGVYQDMTPRDCVFAQKWLATNNPSVSDPNTEVSNGDRETSSSPNEIQGVIINCLGFQKLLKKPKYVEIQISQTDKIFKTGASSEISAHLGLPLLLKKCRSPHSFAENADIDPYKNLEAHFLLMGADPGNGEEWRSANFGPVGSVLVVRKDGKDVTAQQVEALVRYCRDRLLGGMIDVDGEGEEARARFVEDNICRAKFEEFFEGMK